MDEDTSTSIAPMPQPDLSENEDSMLNVRIGIITVSDTLDLQTDEAGKLIKSMASGFEVVSHIVARKKASLIRNEIRDMLLNSFNQVDVMLLVGGTGLSPKDFTIEAVRPLFEKEITGFSNIFSVLAYKEFGSPALLQRSCAGIYRGKVLVCIPDELDSVKLAIEKIINPKIGDFVRLVR